MFRAAVQSSPFCTNIADDCFANISGEHFGTVPDVSFLSTLRALLAPRLSENDHLDFRVSFTCSATLPLNGSENEIMKEMLNDVHLDASNTLCVHICYGALSEANVKCVTAAYHEGASLLKDDGWIRVDKVTEMYRQRNFMVVCFINPETHNTVVFVEGDKARPYCSLSKYHMLQASISVFLPWYFEDAGKSLTEEEFKLINVLYNSKEANDYLNCIEDIALKYDFKSVKIKKMLAGFEKRVDEKKKVEIQYCIERINKDISDLNELIHEKIVAKNEQNIILLGIEEKIARNKDDSEIMNYFSRNDRLVLEDVVNDTITFGVKDYTLYFDEAHVRRMIENKDSYIHRRQHSCISDADMTMLISEIFVEQTVKLRTCAAYKLTIGGIVHPLPHHLFTPEYNGYLPNVHIQRFGCLGTYGTKLNEFMSNGDYIGAIEQCVASCRSLNFADSAVITTFIDILYDDDAKCIELPNKEVVKPSQAIAWLKGQDAQREDKNE